MSSVEIDCVAEFVVESANQMCLKGVKPKQRYALMGLMQRYAWHEMMDVANSQCW